MQEKEGIDMKKLKANFDLRAGILVQRQRDADECQKDFDLWQETECAFFDCTADEHNELLEKVAIAEAAGFPDMYEAIKTMIISGH